MTTNRRRRRWGVGWSVAMVLLSGQFLMSHAVSAACYSTTFTPVCACSGCGYFVFCGVKVGTSAVLDFAYCTGNNPGFMVTGAISSTRGLTSTATASSTCGTATLTGLCCGGARTTTADWSTYQITVPAGSACGPAGTGG